MLIRRYFEGMEFTRISEKLVITDAKPCISVFVNKIFSRFCLRILLGSVRFIFVSFAVLLNSNGKTFIYSFVFVYLISGTVFFILRFAFFAVAVNSICNSLRTMGNLHRKNSSKFIRAMVIKFHA